ncbi:site-specific integrase, partial [Escherichia coli]|nr:site-specific integrase [Escherichia coli]
YIDKISKNTSHNFIFTSTKSNLPPLSYHSIYDIFSKIDCVFKKEYPQFSDKKNIDSVVSITPHVTRHTWAYLILKRIYAAKYQSVMRNCKLAGVDFAIAGLMSEAKDELRLLGGWSHNSRMPEFYARRFLSERANFSNVTRIAADSSEDEFFSLIHQAFGEVIK